MIVDGRMITDTLDGMLQNQHPWIREYFHGPRARAAEAAGAGHQRTWIGTPIMWPSAPSCCWSSPWRVSFVLWYTDQQDKRTYQRYEIYFAGPSAG